MTSAARGDSSPVAASAWMVDSGSSAVPIDSVFDGCAALEPDVEVDGSVEAGGSVGTSATSGGDVATSLVDGSNTEVAAMIGSAGFAGAAGFSGSVVADRNVETARATPSAMDWGPPSPVDPLPDAGPGTRTMSVELLNDSSGAPSRSGVMLSAKTPTRSNPTVAVDAISMRPNRDVGSWGGAANSDG